MFTYMTDEQVQEAAERRTSAFGSGGAGAQQAPLQAVATGNNLPFSDILVGKTFTLRFDNGGPVREYKVSDKFKLQYRDQRDNVWHEADYRAYEGDDNLAWFSHILVDSKPRASVQVAVDFTNGLATSIESHMAPPITATRRPTVPSTAWWKWMVSKRRSTYRRNRSSYRQIRPPRVLRAEGAEGVMRILNLKKSLKTKAADNSRRSFIWKMGAGASSVLASSAGMAAVTARAETGETAGDPALRAALLEEEKVLRKLHQGFEQAMDKGLHEEVLEMFAHDAEVVFNGGVFTQRSQGVSRLYRDHFPSGKTGKRMEPAPGFELAANQQSDSVEVSPDRRSAKAVFPYSIQVGMPFETETSLAAMARPHGEGVRTWWEGGVYRITYRKDMADGRWKIGRLEYDTLSRADYRSGRSYARPISVALFARCFPEDQQGPDALV